MGTGVDALPYVDTLIKEYLLFRGFSATLSAFTKDLAADPGCGFQAERITDMIFRQLIPTLDCQQLVEFLEYLNMQLYSRLDSRHEPLVSAVEADLLRLYLVTAHNARRPDKMAEFFRLYGPQLISSSSSRGSSAASCGAWGLADAAAADWKEWFLLPYLQNPEREPRFQLYFSAEWASLLEVSFRNFIAGVVRSLPLPAVLRFNTDRRLRLALQQQVHALQSELQQTKEQLAATAATLQQLQQITLNTHPQQQGPEASLEQSSQHTQQQQQQQGEFSAAGSRQHRRDPSLGDWQHKLHTVKSSSSAGAAGSTAVFHLPTDLQPGCDAPSPAAAAAAAGGLDEGQELQEFPPRKSQGGSGLFELLPQHSSGVVGVVPGSSSSNSGSTSSGGQGGTLQQQQQQQQQSGLPSRHVRGASFSGSISFDATSAAAGGDDGASKPQEALGVLPPVDALNPGPDVASTGPHQVDPGELLEQFSPQGQPVTTQGGAPVTKSPSGKAAAAAGTAAAGTAAAATAAAGLPPALATGSLPTAAPSSRAMPTPRSSSSSGMGGAVLSSSPVLSWAGGSSSGAPGVRGLTRHLPPGHAAAAAGGSSGSNGSGAGAMGGGVGGLAGGLGPRGPPVPLQVLTAVAVGDGSVSVSYQQHQGTPADTGAAAGVTTAAGGAASGGGGGGGEVVAVAFSPSGGNVASVVGGSSGVAIWSPAGLPGNAARAAVVGCGAPVTCVAWDSRADKLMLIGCAAAGGVRAWHADTRRIMDSVPAEPGFPVVAAVAACPSEPTFVVAANSSSSSGSQPLQGRLVTYNARSFKRSSVLNVPGDTALASLAYSSSGSQLLVGTTAGTALLFEPNSRSSPVRVWQVAAAVARSGASGSAAASSSAAAAVSGEEDADLAVQVLWRPAGAQQVTPYNTSSSGGGPGAGAGAGAAAAGSGSKGPAAGGAGSGGSGGGSILTLCGGVMCEWVLSAASRSPVVAFDLAATVRAVVAEQQGLDPLSEGPEGLSPWHCCAAVAPDGSSLAVLCCAPASGVLLLLSCVSSADQSQSVWASKARVLLAGSMLSRHAHNCAGAISWHPAGAVLVVGGSEGNSIVVRLGD